jgi:hypothetical protein
VLEQQADDVGVLRLAIHGGADGPRERRRVVERVLHRDVGAPLEQDLHHVDVTAIRGERERRAVVAELSVDVHAFVEELLHRRRVALASGVGERVSFFGGGLRARNSAKNARTQRTQRTLVMCPPPTPSMSE